MIRRRLFLVFFLCQASVGLTIGVRAHADNVTRETGNVKWEKGQLQIQAAVKPSKQLPW